ncbi:MAG TPA: HlyD family secretion protein [Drouetiella sp.]|jgi:membrane fusion protein, multidrug efflux system
MSSGAVMEKSIQTTEKFRPTTKRMTPKRLLILSIVGVVAVIAIVAGSIGWRYMSSHESTDDAYVDGNITQISSRVGGTVSQVLIDDNQYVKAGQLLVVLDPRDYDIKIEQAKAALEKNKRQQQADTADIAVTNSTAGAQSDTAASEILHANASIASAKSLVSNTKAALGMEQAKLGSLQAQKQQYETDLKRYANLSQQGAISKQQYDQAKTNYEVSLAQIAAENEAIQQAKANVAKAQSDLQQSFSDLSKTKATLKTAQAAHEQTNVKSYISDVSKATVDQAQADLQNAILQRSYCQIVAPVAGRIGKKATHIGEQVQAGEALFTIIPDQSWLTANFKETQIGRMRPGQAVDVTLDAFPGQHFTGHVDSVAPASGAKFALMPAENATGNFTKIVQRLPVKILFDEKSIAAFKKYIAPGLSAQVTVNLAAMNPLGN